jgi:hypothetical protein
MRATSVFRKRSTALEVQDRRPTEQPSKRTLSTSIFPPASSVPRAFQIAELETRLPTFWHLETTDDGELLLTRDQLEQIKGVLVRERADELHNDYKNRLQEFVVQFERATRAASSRLPPERPDNPFS